MFRSRETMIVNASKVLSAVFASCVIACVTAAQAAEPTLNLRPRAAPTSMGNGCSIHDITDKAYGTASPAQRQIMDQARSELDSFTRQFARDRALNANAAPLEITIPVVVHVVHANGPENLSDARINAAINQVTTDFHAYPLAGNVDGYGYLQANVGFTFKLAKLDPQGRATSGITRTVSNITYNGSEGALQNLIRWPREKYLNIWIVYSSDGSNGSGYSNYPGTVADGTGYESLDGIVMSYWAVGPSATSGYEKVLTHEVGHWANLLHTWGDVYNNGDTQACRDPVGDRVADTPLTTGTLGCTSVVTCGYRANNENFMDYGTCSTMFTIGQSDRMQAALRAAVSRRNNLWTQANLTATGLGTGVPPTGGTLQNGVPKTGLSAATGQNLNFTLDVPAGATNLRFVTTGGTGDSDMHVRFGAAPTLTTYDCRPYAENSNETCNINPAQAGRYYVMLNAYTAISGVTLTGSFTGGGGTTLPECTAGQTYELGKNCKRSNRSMPTGNYDYMAISLPAGVPQLKITVSGGTGNANLYYNSSTWATTGSYQQLSTNAGNSETLTITNPPSGYLYISLHAAAAFSGVTISTEY